jgi:hypothetical protein
VDGALDAGPDRKVEIKRGEDREQSVELQRRMAFLDLRNHGLTKTDALCELGLTQLKRLALALDQIAKSLRIPDQGLHWALPRLFEKSYNKKLFENQDKFYLSKKSNKSILSVFPDIPRQKRPGRALPNRPAPRYVVPMSRKNAQNSVERRARRLATRLGLHFMTCQKPDKQVQAHGGYMLRDGKTMQIVFGDKDYLFSADLDEIEAFLDQRA